MSDFWEEPSYSNAPPSTTLEPPTNESSGSKVTTSSFHDEVSNESLQFYNELVNKTKAPPESCPDEPANRNDSTGPLHVNNQRAYEITSAAFPPSYDEICNSQDKLIRDDGKLMFLLEKISNK